MSIELFNQLEQKVANAVESLEMLKMEAEELREENARLKQEHQEWERRLNGLLDKFRELESSETSVS
ncbi:cell division protein ZapB [Halomonas sp. McH1-25]|uniref:cell division protein ZapB n=1 Tax=unclassified Halomonas TaxID=2609666 RepID=UPI001EF53F38|nr:MULTISPECIES: cell division protein ZapB [unclassified Halomonas]MCG7601684.1 cell division protein ZapB [Halomonas sp. McH1-25]MCP1343323.1 cell division protein ZapB [Halomonas sp. FL8]MCP1362820.1 cell division protein ZapB [Halomonas sp. BBD45]